MDLFELCEAGASLTNQGGAEFPIDVAFAGRGRVVVTEAGWWKGARWSLGNGIHIAMGALSAASDWSFKIDRPDGVIVIERPEDDAVAYAIAQNRKDRDADRDNYRKACVALRDSLGFNDSPDQPAEFPDAERWVDWLTEHPAPPLDELLRQEFAAKRMVGRVLLRDGATGDKVGVLVFDEAGRAVAVGGDLWLQQIAGDYRSRSRADRPPLADYANRIADCSPTTGRMPYGPAVVEQEGTVEEIAMRMFEARTP